MKNWRHHVTRNNLLEIATDLFVIEILRRGDNCDEAAQSTGIRVQHCCFGNVIEAVKRGLDLFELDAIAHVLNLIVPAPFDVELAVFGIKSHEIARAVHDIDKLIVLRILHKTLCSSFRVVVVTAARSEEHTSELQS